MPQEEFRLLLNHVANTNFVRQNVSAWLAGDRTLPDSAVVLLKALVREAQIKRGRPAPSPLRRLGGSSEGRRKRGSAAPLVPP
jgi:hypothetical protein